MKLAILGAGAWGTALAIAFARHHQVTLWARDAGQAAQMGEERVNRRYLPDCPFPEGLALTADLAAALQDAELALIVTPMAGLRPTLKALKALKSLPPVLWACKGFEAGSSLLPHQVVAEELPADHRCGVLSGPSFAREVAQGLPAAVTIASDDAEFAARVARELHSPLLRLYANDDLVGVEVGGAVKNVMAIATGVADGLDFGLNARAALITRGLAEISRLGVALGASPQTMMGLSGMGDLILTCTGALSRNRQVGLKLAEGKPLEQALRELGHVAEGVATAREVLTMAERLEVDMPITAAVCGLLYQGNDPQQVVAGLLGRSPKSESGAMLD
ncbi:NAD(P)-dependent glycerol-3-phosphate dehydrogenase [Chromobacterium subtsugae]|uniref:Glycerol-3-phosphate dehydrogenase [NAD(P)+] n=1 Tax=Chromobacterium subtsugae TaxID=251747 RepID=A0ABS7FI23_9NEIS|nr:MULTISPECIES: NAD(P)H-dependent glycerol-3-phosphate dehydrogenase [Chromobacterium]KUM05613.1 glycerol-3-phosphate dehydrogenase [Chromobacterium subtsugae]KZE85369.1 glycerol-3-phosphate dehydrogenase [Chromobacterium sp. F49]MBW7568793.1 NAD(P)-dependent glycerol-3-phosphate dehydrogenase [Chromobacterium subtsugae]MBW8289730.1 NAD(P)-dependent glycerol-3-phosphate dehydrogenase [Chromobacterium subtsugae]OBU85103.1 glycerol-3-phosphate dehydrogenase [Chromobacterium subtsugae]